MVLADQPPLGSKNKVARTREIEFAAPVDFKPKGNKSSLETKAATTKPTKPKDETKSISWQPKGIAWKALKNMLPSEVSLPDEISIDDVALGRELEIKLQVSWKGARKEDSSNLLDTISNQLRHVDTELDYSIKTKGGATISKAEMKLKKPISVSVGDNGFVKREELWPKMKDWLIDLLEAERVVSE